MSESTPTPYVLPEPVAAPPPSAWARLSAWAGRLTVADGLAALAVVVAALLRFRALGGPPLSPSEAAAALSSWQFSHAGATVSTVTSPAYFTLTNVAMLLFGSSDAIARLVPALLGTLTVALIWALPRALRPAGVVTTAFFLAVSPLNVLASRTAGGAAIAVFALVLLVAAALRLGGGGRRGWAYALGLAVGLGLSSDPLFYSGLVTLVPLALWLGSGATAAGERPLAAVVGAWRPILVAFAVSFLALSTSFLLYTPGLGAAFDVAAAWLAGFGLPGSSDGGLLAPLVTLVRYEPALMFLGVPAILWALWQRDRLAWLLAGWWVVLLALALFQPGLPWSALVFTVPGYLLVGMMAGGLWSRISDDRWVVVAVTGGLLLLGMILLVSLGRYTRLGLWASDQVAFLVLALVAFVAAGGVLILAMSYSSLAARQGAFLGIALLMLYAQGGTATSLTQQGANDPRERIVAVGTDDDIRVLSSVLRDVSRQITGGDHDLEIISTADSPVLRWYLRDYERAQFAATLPVGAVPQAIITPASAELRLSSDYLGADFGLQQRRAELVSPFSLNDTLKWLLFRESTTAVDIDRVILWVRSDLTGTRGP